MVTDLSKASAWDEERGPVQRLAWLLHSALITTWAIAVLHPVVFCGKETGGALLHFLLSNACQ